MIATTAASTSTNGHHGVPPPSSLAAAVVVGDSVADGASVAGGGGSVAGGALVSRGGRVTDGPVLSASLVGGSVLGTKVTDGAESPPPGAEMGGLVAEDGSVPEPPPEPPHAPRSTAALTRAASRGMAMAHPCRLLVRRRGVCTTGIANIPPSTLNADLSTCGSPARSSSLTSSAASLAFPVCRRGPAPQPGRRGRRPRSVHASTVTPSRSCGPPVGMDSPRPAAATRPQHRRRQSESRSRRRCGCPH